MNYKTRQSILIFLLLFVPLISLAQYQPLVGIPTLEKSNDFGAYMNALYGLSISIAALIAVIKIIIAGVKYMMTDLVSGKSEAKSDIQGSLLGLLIIISAVLILNQINPQLSRNNLFLSRSPSGVTPTSPTTTSKSPTDMGGYQITECSPTTSSSPEDTSQRCLDAKKRCEEGTTPSTKSQVMPLPDKIMCYISKI